MRHFDWDAVASRSYGEYKSVAPGWYPGVILKAVEGQSAWGTPSVTFFFDITDGEYKGFFGNEYKASTASDKKWRGTLEQSIDDRGLPFFKGLITAVLESNPGYKWDFDETKLKGKLVGIGFRREWYEKNGEDKSVVKAFAFCDIKKVLEGSMTAPKDKPKKQSSGGSAVPVPPALANPYLATSAPALEPITDEDELPF